MDVELRAAGDRDEIARTCRNIAEHLRTLDLPDAYWEYIEIGRAKKKNFAERLSKSLAQKVADALRPWFRGILPDEEGLRHESRAMGAGGLKKIDVLYMTPEIGIGLAVSLKTYNFRDERTRRFTKNVKRVDGELRAEAEDVHRRQPFAVLVGLVLFPREAAMDGIDGRSSVKHAWDAYNRRSGRRDTAGEASSFERVFLGVYDSSPPNLGDVVYFDVESAFPDRGLPDSPMTMTDVVAAIRDEFDRRNKRRR